MRRLHRSAALIVAATLMLVQPTLVMGNHFGSDWDHTCDATTASQCVGYSFYQSWMALSLEAGQLSATQYACTSIYDPLPDVDCHEIIPSFLVNVLDDSYGTAYFAWTACSPNANYKGSTSTHTRACDWQYLKYDISHTTAFDTQTERRKIACHELGHTFGLRHSTTDGTSTCMTAVATQSTVIGISAHDKSHIAAYYH